MRGSVHIRMFATVMSLALLWGNASATADTLYGSGVFVPNDSYYAVGGGGSANPGQWYLYNTVVPGLDINILPAWNRGITGAGVVIGIIDDCLEAAHPDLAPNYRADLSWNFGNNTNDPSPVYATDGHGVMTAGLAAARGGNGIGITGAAPYAGLAGLRVDFASQDQQQIIDAILYKPDAIRVKNNSYCKTEKYSSDSDLVDANRLSASMGVINVRSAGNSRFNANTLALQSDRMAITVAAMGMDGKYSPYSNYGACVFVTAPSSGGAPSDGLPRITTTDRTGSLGYSDGTNTNFPDAAYTMNFGGTSASAPLVSGAVAMILQVNPNLDVRGVKYVLANTSRIVDASNSQWITNAAGFHFNPYYGFGLIDVDAATRFAETFQQPGAEISYTTGLVKVLKSIPDNNPAGRDFTFNLTGGAPMESVELIVNTTQKMATDLSITLISPSGTRSQLAYSGGDVVYVGNGFSWTFSSVAFWGENATGTWTINIADEIAGNTGMFSNYTFTAYAAAPEPASILALTAGMFAVIRRRSLRHI